MQIFFLTPLGAFFLNVFIWTFLHLGISFCSSRIPVERFRINNPLYQTFCWEKMGCFTSGFSMSAPGRDSFLRAPNSFVTVFRFKNCPVWILFT